MKNSEVKIKLNDGKILTGNLRVPGNATGLVIFAHGSGSSRLSPRNNFVAEVLNKWQIATLLTDLLTPKEDEVYQNRFNISLLSDRLVNVTEWTEQEPSLQFLPVGYFGASTGAAAALQAAAILGSKIRAVVSRGGRPDLANHLLKVKAPTLLIIGSLDTDVIVMNEQAYDQLAGTKKIEIVPGASHLFEEPGTLDKAAQLAAGWFEQHLAVHTISHNHLKI
jgi:putative phosphoribosyl transferase